MKKPPTFVEFCPHCRQPLLKDATCPPGSGSLKCDDCDQPALFIQNRRALCLKHAKFPALARVMNNFFNRHKIRDGRDVEP